MTQSPFANKLQLFRQHLYFKSVLLFQKLGNRTLYSEIKALAAHLEGNLFPPLRDQRIKWADIHVSADCRNLLFRSEDKPDQALPATENLAKVLSRHGANTIRLDARLEEGQIIEILSIFLHAAPYPDLPTTNQPPTPLYITNKQKLARTLTSEAGLHKFCAQINFLPNENLLRIEYSYCELFYTYSLKQTIGAFSKTKNHRALFALAPRAGLLTFVLLLGHIWFWGTGSANELGAGLFASAILGIGVSYLIQTLASVIYYQEHRDVLLEESMREITALSHFPVTNPNPILKVDAHGNFLFHNKAATALLAEMGEEKDKLEMLLPDNFLELIRTCIASKTPLNDIEVVRNETTIRHNISPFPNEQAVLIAGNDISRLKKLEKELREFNLTLEEKVVERTKELQSTQDVTIMSLTSLAEARDPETGAHIQRTRSYVKILAEHLRKHPRFQEYLADDQVIELLYRSAPLHDIGKVGIKDSILLKPTKLTPDEFEEMKKHPVIGGDSLRWAEKQLGTNSFLRYAREIAYHHHEKWDGSGYPYGLAGDAIPFSGRLMALADVYDALINKRVYKTAYSHEKAKTIIVEARGTHFDPAIVDTFLQQEKAFLDIAARYKEA